MTKGKPKKKSKGSPSKSASSSTLFTKSNLIFLVVIAIAGIIAFLPVIHGEFLNYDDELYITQNQALTGFDLPALFSGYIGNQYSPVAMSIMAFEIKLLGLQPGGLKLISIMLHLLNGLLAFVFVKKLIRRDAIALLVSALFTVHTLQVESVAWLTASMKIGTYSLFSLASLISYLNFRQGNQRVQYILSLMYFLLAGLCKEQAVVLPLLLMLIDYFQGRKWFSRPALLEKVPFFIIALGIGLATMRVAGDMRGTGTALPYSMLERLLFACMAFANYAWKELLPVHLSTYYIYPPQGEIPGYYYATPFFVLAVLWLLYYTWRKGWKLYFFGIAFFVVNIVLTLFSQIFSVRDVIMADRYVYLSSIGFFLCLVQLISNVADTKHWNKKSVYLAIGVYALLLTGLTWQRSRVWHDTITMFSDAIDYRNAKGYKGATPTIALPYSNRGLAKKRAGDLEGAMADYNAAIQANPGYPTGFLNRGNLYFLQKKPDLAIKDQNRAIELDPNNYLAYANRGAALASAGQYDQALTDFNKSLSLQPNFQDGLSNRALTYYTMGNNQAALNDVEQYLRINPGDANMQAFRQEIMAKMQ